MRSGQYKVSGGSVPPDGEVTLGHFKSSSTEVMSSDFPHLNSLVVTANRFNDSQTSNSNGKNKKPFAEKSKDLRKSIKPIDESTKPSSNDANKNTQVGQNSSDVGGTRHAFNKVEQKVRILLQQGEAKLKAESHNSESSSNTHSQENGWQYGHMVTMPRRPKNSIAFSHSALHTIGSSDTASCISASSGYSSSNSSSYGSFKSSDSTSSKLPNHKEEMAAGEDALPAKSGTMTLVDNPLYDVTPAHARASLTNILHEGPQMTPLSRTSYKTLSTSEGSRLALINDNSALHDPVARRCREYFEQRLVNSETFCHRWSLCSNESGDTDSPPSSMSTNNDPSSIGSASSSGSVPAQSAKKTPLDEKMDFLRKEIADLVHQDNALFQQLLTLHHSISALKQDQQEAWRPSSPASVGSFSEEEEEEGEEEEEEHFMLVNENAGRGSIRETVRRKSSHPCDMQDAYVPPNSYVTSEPFFGTEQTVDTSSNTASSKSSESSLADNNNCPVNYKNTELSNNLNCQKISNDISRQTDNANNNNNTIISSNDNVSNDSNNNSSNDNSFQEYTLPDFNEDCYNDDVGHHQDLDSFDLSYKSDEYLKSDSYTTSDIDEGLYTDMSLSHSTSPASTLSKASTTSSCSSRKSGSGIRNNKSSTSITMRSRSSSTLPNYSKHNTHTNSNNNNNNTSSKYGTIQSTRSEHGVTSQKSSTLNSGLKSFCNNISNNIRRSSNNLIRSNTILSKVSFGQRNSMIKSKNETETGTPKLKSKSYGKLNVIGNSNNNNNDNWRPSITRSNSSSGSVKTPFVNRKQTIFRSNTINIQNSKNTLRINRMRSNSNTALETITRNKKNTRSSETMEYPKCESACYGRSLTSLYKKDSKRSVSAHLNRNKVSIPPSSRNRDRSCRPESLRLSSNMASHTRVLLKARSFLDYPATSAQFCNTLPLSRSNTMSDYKTSSNFNTGSLQRSISVSGPINSIETTNYQVPFKTNIWLEDSPKTKLDKNVLSSNIASIPQYRKSFQYKMKDHQIIKIKAPSKQQEQANTKQNISKIILNTKPNPVQQKCQPQVTNEFNAPLHPRSRSFSALYSTINNDHQGFVRNGSLRMSDSTSNPNKNVKKRSSIFINFESDLLNLRSKNLGHREIFV